MKLNYTREDWMSSRQWRDTIQYTVMDSATDVNRGEQVQDDYRLLQHISYRVGDDVKLFDEAAPSKMTCKLPSSRQYLMTLN